MCMGKLLVAISLKTRFSPPSAIINFRETWGPWKPLPSPGQNANRPSLVITAQVQECISRVHQEDLIPQHPLPLALSFFTFFQDVLWELEEPM